MPMPALGFFLRVSQGGYDAKGRRNGSPFVQGGAGCDDRVRARGGRQRAPHLPVRGAAADDARHRRALDPDLHVHLERLLLVWNDYFWAVVLTQGAGSQPVTAGITSFNAQYRAAYHLMSAGSIVAALPPVARAAVLSGVTAWYRHNRHWLRVGPTFSRSDPEGNRGGSAHAATTASVTTDTARSPAASRGCSPSDTGGTRGSWPGRPTTNTAATTPRSVTPGMRSTHSGRGARGAIGPSRR